MAEYLSPGVYVEEVDRGPKPIEGVGTAMAVFVGFTEKAEWQRQVDGEMVTENLLNKPQLVTNWSQYVERFGGFVEGIYLPHAVYGYFQNGGSRCYVVSVKTIGKAQAALLGADGKPHLVVRAKQAGFDGLRLRVKVDVPELPAPKAKGAAKGKEGEARKARKQPQPRLAASTVHHHRRAPGGQRRLAGEGSAARGHPGRGPRKRHQEGPGGLQEQQGVRMDRR